MGAAKLFATNERDIAVPPLVSLSDQSVCFSS